MTMTTYPRPTDNPAYGLSRDRDKWLAFYYVDGKRRAKTLAATTLAQAMAARDHLHANLAAAGALRVDDPAVTEARRLSVDPDCPTTFIHFVKPFRVKVGQIKVGDYLTREEAIAARNKHLGIGGGK